MDFGGGVPGNNDEIYLHLHLPQVAGKFEEPKIEHYFFLEFPVPQSNPLSTI